MPYGHVDTYGGLAQRIGKPRAARAVGGALNRNPIPIVVPCHRIVGASGSLVGYAGGLERKQALLGLEGALLGCLGRLAGPGGHAAQELAPELLSGEPAAVARIGDEEVEGRRGFGRAVGLAQASCRTRSPRFPDDGDLAGADAVQADVALLLVERPERLAPAEDPHAASVARPGGRSYAAEPKPPPPGVSIVTDWPACSAR